MSIYDGFNDWADVQKQFEMKDAEPDEVLLARYDGGGYEGDALVLFRRGEKYFLNSGGHCSCYGLEGQWSPEEYGSKEEFASGHKPRHVKEEYWMSIPHDQCAAVLATDTKIARNVLAQYDTSHKTKETK